MLGTIIQVIPPENNLKAVYISGYRSANNEAKFRQMEIQYVICMMKVQEKEYRPLKFLSGSKVGQGADRIKICEIDDTEISDISRYFFEYSTFIHEARKLGNILIHCDGDDLSRSSSIVIAYLMVYDKMKYEEALEKIRTEYKYAAPNFGFKMQLLELQKFLSIDFKKFQNV